MKALLVIADGLGWADVAESNAVSPETMPFLFGLAKQHGVARLDEARWEPGVINILDMGVLTDPLEPGELALQGGEAAFRALERGIQMCLSKALDGIVTAPLNKEALHLAGHQFDGHTEILGHFCGKRPTYMLLSSERMKIAHVSTHCSLREACDRAKKPRVLLQLDNFNQGIIRRGPTHN